MLAEVSPFVSELRVAAYLIEGAFLLGDVR
jgi:hypothetical protein